LQQVVELLPIILRSRECSFVCSKRL